MKIRSFKGHSLERIYDTIQREMGPEAVIVTHREPSGVRSMLPSFLGGSAYEVVAVADDRASDEYTLSKALGEEPLRRLSDLQTRKLTAIEEQFTALRNEIRSQPRSAGIAPVAPANGFPPFAQGWDHRFLRRIIGQHPGFPALTDTDAQRNALGPLLPIAKPFPVKQTPGPHIIVFTGPTGSGKTTTLAKLASRWSLGHKLKVGLITADTYRVAAVDQIREYATLLGLELKIVFSVTEVPKAVKAFADKDLILVDTVGRSLYDQSGLIATQGLLKAMGNITTLLVIPATWSCAGVSDLIRNFRMPSPTYLVITKLDETRSYDILTYAAAEAAAPIAFLTNGQRVPQDLQDAQPADIATLLIPSKETLN